MSFRIFFKDHLSFPQEKKQKILIAVLIFVLFITAIVFYFGLSDKGDIGEILTATSTKDEIYLIDKAIKDIDFDIGFLDYLDNLEIYGIRPSGEIEKGTTNPFLQD